MPVVTSCVITAEPVKLYSRSPRHLAGLQTRIVFASYEIKVCEPTDHRLGPSEATVTVTVDIITVVSTKVKPGIAHHVIISVIDTVTVAIITVVSTGVKPDTVHHVIVGIIPVVSKGVKPDTVHHVIINVTVIVTVGITTVVRG